eukprot:TRINITY_DN2107_c0_g2_i1.p1 TRINITY_DN2107_c0_g2~~TRINITY_DN2107_c0_g2_i1.p1  ORF type:complete len:299 (-),score=77.82 TRINITY_DN2107_c0_g2_i1:896-1792(-)
MEILARGIARAHSLIHLDLRSTAMRTEAADSLFRALCENKSLVCLSLGNVRGQHRNLLAGRAMAGIEKYLRSSVLLTFLDLKGAGVGNEGALHVLNGLLGNRSVKALNLCMNNINGAGSSIIIDMMVKSLLKRLDVSQNALGNEFVTELHTRMEKLQFMLTHLSLASCGFINSLKKLLAPLKSGIFLEKVDLSGANFEEAELTSITSFISGYSALKSFSLADCHLGDRGAVCVATGLSESCTIEHLNLSRNRITNVGIMALTDKLSSLTTINITALDLSYNWIEVSTQINVRTREECD